MTEELFTYRLEQAIEECPLMEEVGKGQLLELAKKNISYLVAQSACWDSLDFPEMELTEKQEDVRLFREELKELIASEPSFKTLLARIFIVLYWKELTALHFADSVKAVRVTVSPFIYTMV